MICHILLIQYYLAYIVAKYPKNDGYQRGLDFMVYKFLDKMSATGANKVGTTHSNKN